MSPITVYNVSRIIINIADMVNGGLLSKSDVVDVVFNLRSWVSRFRSFLRPVFVKFYNKDHFKWHQRTAKHVFSSRRNYIGDV